MKKIIIVITTVLLTAAAGANAQVRTDAAMTPRQVPVNNHYQFPNYLQSNASYINNSMQNNKPHNANIPSCTGNGGIYRSDSERCCDFLNRNINLVAVPYISTPNGTNATYINGANNVRAAPNCNVSPR